ncbi:1-phosphofructokinase [Mycobacterium sp. CBMA293]|uniref:1-phosphofructokinase n=1 Tax=unclassified Mycolicibacterium TaxID=2636767 RepID=UPI001321C350|nr:MULTISPECIES: 1-phosphofructokinase [unclassified Mycolicibacterium]MUL47532.1 1-phosphofructokinase [Mycolicibacterium sp. CBMA 360]MUL94888.1 1-phosphofructokinase [Mycolicibacterium sp. CBMA 230]MUM30867.1 1-phosphofructokinase [Mycolicibacterium sp. CBMA 361]MUL59520.1 1-phosphofructokinase [Mycolicibacterium sp. CBMA 335]MUL71245.1 1-phosphofructokinase [Mycolicibacterium sp. CBMA 311]
MIVTVTLNPSLDRTLTLNEPLTRGAVHRLTPVSTEPGGKGVNVSRALTQNGVESVALLPAADHDPILSGLQARGVPFHNIDIPGAVRSNLTITENDGTTTKLNEPGAPLDDAAIAALTAAISDHAARASWVVLSGSLPPGVPDRWYSDIVAHLAPLPCQVAVDTSEHPLTALAEGFPIAAPDLIKPNSEELAWLTGNSAQELETSAAHGNPLLVVSAARQLITRGANTVLVTLGGAGAVLVDHAGAWVASAPAIVPRSTVGAGDASLAGYLAATTAGAPLAERLRTAVAYGSAAAALPGSALPTPGQINVKAVRVQAVTSVTTPL